MAYRFAQKKICARVFHEPSMRASILSPDVRFEPALDENFNAEPRTRQDGDLPAREACVVRLSVSLPLWASIIWAAWPLSRSCSCEVVLRVRGVNLLILVVALQAQAIRGPISKLGKDH